MADDLITITPRRGIESTVGSRLRRLRPLVVAWTVRDLRVRYRQSVLRSGWSLLQPVTILVTYGWVLTAVLDVKSPEAPYLTFAWSGIVPFTFFAQGLGQGVGSIQQAGSIVSRVYFPREVLPLSAVGGALVDLAIMLATLLVVVVAQVGVPGATIVGLVPVMALLMLWTTAITLIASAITVFRRDLNFAVPLFLRVLFIATPVMYPASLIAERAGWLNALNPLTVAIEGTRDALYRGAWPDWSTVGPHLVAATVALVAAAVLFRRLEPRMSDFV